MAMWRYTAEGGEHTVDETDLRARIRAGMLPGSARVFCVDDGQWHRVDVDFVQELNVAEYEAGKRPVAEAKAKRSFLGRHQRALVALALLVIGGAWYWWFNRVTCSRPEVQQLVREITQEKLLKFTKGGVVVHNISTVGSFDSGGARCSADIEISGTDLYDGLHGIEYSAEDRDNKIYVSAHLTR